MNKGNPIISGSGSYIPTVIKKNTDFLNIDFYTDKEEALEGGNAKIIEKFKVITGIEQRRYLAKEWNNSDMGFFAAEKAIKNANVDKETIDYIFYAHNYGDIEYGNHQSNAVPSLASRVKYRLGIENPNCVAYDILVGCPGWVQGLIQADAFIKAGLAKKCLIIGGETLSRVIDIHDRDSMIYADGAGACILEESQDQNSGIIHSGAQTHTKEETYFLTNGESYKKEAQNGVKYLKMKGRKIYEFVISNVPQAMKETLDQSGESIEDLKMVFIHQANEKMDEAILKRFYRLYKMKVPENIMPMTINKLGNSSVATIPTLYDLVQKNEIKDHKVEKGDLVMFASVGAGMNINAVVYRV